MHQEAMVCRHLQIAVAEIEALGRHACCCAHDHDRNPSHPAHRLRGLPHIALCRRGSVNISGLSPHF